MRTDSYLIAADIINQARFISWGQLCFLKSGQWLLQVREALFSINQARISVKKSYKYIINIYKAKK